MLAGRDRAAKKYKVKSGAFWEKESLPSVGDRIIQKRNTDCPGKGDFDKMCENSTCVEASNFIQAKEDAERGLERNRKKKNITRFYSTLSKSYFQSKFNY